MIIFHNQQLPLFKQLLLIAITSTFVITLTKSLTAQDDLLAQEERALQQAVSQVAASVVQLEVLGGLETGNDGPVSGLVVSNDGYILSSAVNFRPSFTSILASTPSGKRATATLVSHDYNRNLVLLKVNTTEQYTTASPVPHTEIIVGQWSIALGKTYSREVVNQSLGIISATNRIWGKAIQTDAKISPANYGGPLIDIQGRVYGILTPLSPRGQNPTDGTDWYDSGIGFAVPLIDILPHLDTLKAGKDLHSGLLGVSLKSGDIYDLPAEIVAVQPKSPARTGGLQKGDTIIKVNDVLISRQAQLRHALGSQYAGNTIAISVKRDDQVVTTKVTLVEKLEPYEHPLLGVLPDRNFEKPGTKIRHIYMDSPAQQVKLQPGDIITHINNEAVADHNALRLVLSNFEPLDELTLTYLRNNEPTTVSLELGNIPQQAPTISPHATPTTAAAADTLATGLIDLKLPEEKNECVAIIPTNYRHDVPHALIVWLQAPGEPDNENLQAQWAALGEQYQAIVLAPQSADPARWNPSEVDFIRKTIDNVLSIYTIDRNRIVVHGQQAGGSMSYLVGFSHRDLIRGVAPLDASLPIRAAIKANDPGERLAFYAFNLKESKLAKASAAGLKRLTAAKYPVTAVQLSDKAGLSDSDRIQFLQWVDSLDRI
ncbi:MAG: PDZ domain-containing protein [Planctomycetaceae bacterium]|jgi:serine protease Do|nr:PDZ domain-containing protein [Planctomycetaceae bacterium]MBT4724161.1 PDZ domain-containing protein [Planctomycetaceae bacterium]MBT5125295.1 PDZ domain-containing protein [Planctomycetaceae bacterium]MBT5884527.1 PDZ domain-containing protein [Planctomycetaceae bacterium]MBT7919418.1 PDZ domain-containing protein [Planctomycetaceae bacterium]